MKSLRGLGRILNFLFVAILIANVLGIASDLDYLRFLGEAEDRLFVASPEREFIEGHQALSLIATYGLLILCGVFFMGWLYRAHRNLERGGIRNVRRWSGWAVLGFILPFVNLVLPYLVMLEARRGSALLSVEADERPRFPQPGGGLVALWWLSFLAYTIASNVHLTLLDPESEGTRSMSARDLEYSMAAAGLVSKLLALLSATLALRLVREITRHQGMAPESLSRSSGMDYEDQDWDVEGNWSG